MNIRKAALTDQKQLLALYLKVAENPRGIARTVEEIDASYISNLFESVEKNDGLFLVGLDNRKIVAAILASKYGLKIFDHILSNLTVLVHPNFQGKGFGKQLFLAFLEIIKNERPDILRVELESRSSNQKSLGLYRSIGFQQEGVMKNKTRNLDGGFEDSLLFAWSHRAE